MLILAHRGASGYAPENTLAAFDLGHRMGANGIETDVQLSRDGVMVLIHDERVDRTTDGSGRVADLTWEELSRLDAGGWFAPEFAGQRIMQLAPFLDRYLGATVLPPRGPEEAARSQAEPAEPGPTEPTAGGSSPTLTICLEAKAPAAAGRMAALLHVRGLSRRRDLQLTSFDWGAAVELRAALPDLVVGYLTPRFGPAEIDKVADAGLAQICPRADLLTPELVARARERGLQVRAWGVSTRAHVQRAFECEIDGTTLNWPDWAFGPGVTPEPPGPEGTGA